ncbi:MAG: hypothetical protein EHM73_04615 [Chroococcales cyanobacterium metabat2.561]|jgi:hypothetical protein|nr:MAG: hypothetical protein EHM73_04615 [Chroococcales cyanobacterium metabat2.561]
MLKSLISKGLSVPRRCENRYKSVEYRLHIRIGTHAQMGINNQSLITGFSINPVTLPPYHNSGILSKKFLLCNKTTQKLDQRCSGKKG